MAIQNWTIWFLWLAFAVHQAESTVFLSATDANKVISRSKRARFILLEEFLQGNLERECLEERCTYEEAREALEDTEKTDKFWNGYFNGLQCSSSPCLHNSLCKDNIRSYTCECSNGFEGANCAFAKNECRHELNVGCQQFCYPGSKSYHCSCAKGYELGKDSKSCIPKDHCACGRSGDHLPIQVNASERVYREFPWQVLLLNSEGKWFCGGVLLKNNFVLTTAQCAQLSPISVVIVLRSSNNGVTLKVILSDLSGGTETSKGDLSQVGICFSDGINRTQRDKQVILVKKINTHIRYDNATGENNLALLELRKHVDCSNHHLSICIPERDFAEHVLLSKLVITLSGWQVHGNQSTASLAQLSISYLNENECKQALNRSLITREFCGYNHELPKETLAGGSFSAVDYKGTWFLTGILEPQATEASEWDTLIFTKTSRYMMWFKQIMK